PPHLSTRGTTLSAARPAPYGLVEGSGGAVRVTVAPQSWSESLWGSGTRVFHPEATVSTHSVSGRTVVQTRLSRNASFCRPPESVTTLADARTAETRPAYGSGRPTCTWPWASLMPCSSARATRRGWAARATGRGSLPSAVTR